MKNDLIDYMINAKLVGELIGDKFGNYGKKKFFNIIVVQKALQVTDGMRFLAIIHEIKGVVKSLKHSSHGRKIYDNLMTSYGDYLQNNNSNSAVRRKSFMTGNNYTLYDN
jgi:hypothetical protein